MNNSLFINSQNSQFTNSPIFNSYFFYKRFCRNNVTKMMKPMIQLIFVNWWIINMNNSPINKIHNSSIFNYYYFLNFFCRNKVTKMMKPMMQMRMVNLLQRKAKKCLKNKLYPLRFLVVWKRMNKSMNIFLWKLRSFKYYQVSRQGLPK